MSQALMPVSELKAREAVIEHGKQAFIEVGLALMDIRDRRGYMAVGFETFEAYCQTRWGFERSIVYGYIGAAQLSTQVDIPNMEFTQARELSRLSSPSTNGDKRRKVIDAEAVKEVAAKIDFTTATVKDVARAVDIKLAERRNSTVTYHNQPAIHASRGAVPLAGNSHVYTVAKLLWPEDVEALLSGLLIQTRNPRPFEPTHQTRDSHLKNTRFYLVSWKAFRPIQDLGCVLI